MRSDPISLSELRTHNSLQDLWIVVHGQVYDLTSFAHDHPGGLDILRESAGTDGSEAYEYAGHSESAMKKMEKLRIGVLEGECSEPSLGVKEKAGFRAGVSGAWREGVARDEVVDKGDRLVVGFEVMRRTGLWLVAMVAWLASVYSWLSPSVNLTQWHNTTTGFSLYNLLFLVDGRWLERYSFFGGMILALMVSCIGWGVLYSRFVKTLEPEKEVFKYPAVIPRREMWARGH